MSDRRLVFQQFRELQKKDKQEGMIPSGFWESWETYMRRRINDEELIASTRKTNEKHVNDLRCFDYASCWNMAKTENALMWMAYAPKGIAIKSTVNKLRRAKIDPESEVTSIGYDRIVYADDWHELSKHGLDHEGILLARLFLHTKRKAFDGENEVRFRIQLPVSVCSDAANCPPWFLVKFENLDWIERVVAESSIAPWAIETIRQLTDQHGLSFEQSGI